MTKINKAGLTIMFSLCFSFLVNLMGFSGIEVATATVIFVIGGVLFVVDNDN